MNFNVPDNAQIIARLSVMFAFTICFPFAVYGQEEQHFSQLPAPPPMKFVTRDERAQLNAARDAKARTRLSIELAEARLLRAETMTSGQQFIAASAELGSYQGLMEDALRFLGEVEKRNKLRDLYKRVEIALRTHGARLEAIRRTTPAEYAVNVKAIADYTRSARTEALNAFYGDTVIREGMRQEGNAFDAVNKKDSSSDPQKKQP